LVVFVFIVFLLVTRIQDAARPTNICASVGRATLAPFDVTQLHPLTRSTAFLVRIVKSGAPPDGGEGSTV
jgi:hypothetical protein